jgi:hypothetical protein
MSWSIIKKEQACCPFVALALENIDCLLDLCEHIIVIEVAVTVFSGLEDQASFAKSME